MDKTKILIIVGPTAIGKTRLSLDLACETNGEIISADSMQIYKYMDIGTAKPTPDERKKAKHHLVDILFPDEEFSAALFKERAGKIISDLDKQDKTPIVTGGTGLYIKALTRGLFESPPVDRDIRQSLQERAASVGSECLHRELAEIDPTTAARLHPNDLLRIIRALEVYQSTKIPLSEHHEKHSFSDSPFETLKIGLTLDRQQLYTRIEDRVDKMIITGLVDEVKSLLNMGYTMDLNSMQALGYKQIILHLSGDISLDEAISLIKRDTKRYAKRQITWFNADPEIIRYSSGDKYTKILQRAKDFLKVKKSLYKKQQ